MTTPDLSHAQWRRSSKSSGQGGQCIEVARVPSDLSSSQWRKSSKSSPQGSCVEVARVAPAVAVRDSKDPDGAALLLTEHQWSAFLGGLHRSR